MKDELFERHRVYGAPTIQCSKCSKIAANVVACEPDRYGFVCSLCGHVQGWFYQSEFEEKYEVALLTLVATVLDASIVIEKNEAGEFIQRRYEPVPDNGGTD